jgi:uncharacterized membrane protein YeaQ/YmgE (transglycosylase-associated protein family)
MPRLREGVPRHDEISAPLTKPACVALRAATFLPFRERKDMWNLVVFAVIGLLAGTAARLLYPGRQPLHVLGTMVLGMVGAVVGGMISWAIWPAVEDQMHSGNFFLAILGAVMVMVFWTCVAYARSISGSRPTSP